MIIPFLVVVVHHLVNLDLFQISAIKRGQIAGVNIKGSEIPGAILVFVYKATVDNADHLLDKWLKNCQIDDNL